MRIYSADVDRHPLLTPPEEVQCAQQMASGDIDSRNRLVTGHLRFVLQVANDYRGLAPMADLVGAGNMGLLAAAERFDPSAGYRFITYAVWWIRASIFELCTQRTIHIPKNRRRDRERLQVLLTKGASRAELSASGFTDRRIDDLLTSPSVDTSLNAPLADSERTLADIVASELPSPESECTFRDQRNRLKQHVKQLPPMHAYVIRLYYGLDHLATPMTMAQVARRLGRSRERIRQIIEAAHDRLRKKLLATSQELGEA